MYSLIELLRHTVPTLRSIKLLFIVLIQCILDTVMLHQLYMFFQNLEIGKLEARSAYIVISAIIIANVVRPIVLSYGQFVVEQIRVNCQEQLAINISTQPENNEKVMFIVNEIDNLTNTLLYSLSNALITAFVSSFVLCYLLYSQPTVAFFSMSAVLIGYLVSFLVTSPILKKQAKQKITYNKLRISKLLDIQNLNWFINGMGLWDPFIEIFQKESSRLAKVYQRSYVISQLPRFAVEAIILSGIVTLAYFLGKGNEKTLSIFALLGLSALKILPGVQAVFFVVANLKYQNNTLGIINGIFKKKIKVTSKSRRRIDKIHLNGLNLNEIDNVHSSKILDDSYFLGDVVKVSGRSGIGKSTFLKTIILQKNEKIIFYDGEECVNEAVKISYMDQINYIITGDAIVNVKAFNTKHDEEIRGVVNKLGISNLLKIKDLGEASGGEKQRINFARAILADANVVILDEPFSALDAASISILKQFVSKNRKNKIIFYVSHGVDFDDVNKEINLDDA